MTTKCMKILTLLGACLIHSIVAHAVENQIKASPKHTIRPGSVIADYKSLRFEQPYIVQRLTKRTYFVSVNTYNSTFYVGENGVLLFDPMSGGRIRNGNDWNSISCDLGCRNGSLHSNKAGKNSRQSDPGRWPWMQWLSYHGQMPVE